MFIISIISMIFKGRNVRLCLTILIMTLNINVAYQSINQNSSNKFSDIRIYVYPPFSKNITLPTNCTFSNKTKYYHNIVCVCKQDTFTCDYLFAAKDILAYITFNQAYYMAKDINKHGYLINEGINNFKMNPGSCTDETCHSATVTYLIINSSNYVITIVNNY